MDFSGICKNNEKKNGEPGKRTRMSHANIAPTGGLGKVNVSLKSSVMVTGL